MQPSPEIIFEHLSAHQRTAALEAAIELDLFRAVGQGPGDIASLARQCSASERGIRILCDYLTIMELLRKEDGKYRHTPVSDMFLDPQSPACVASIARFMGNTAMREPYHRLADIVRHGRTSLPGQGSVEPENPIWVDFAVSMAPLVAPMAGPLADAVLRQQSGPIRVLDIAAGHGLFGIAIAKKNPEATIVALDWAPVLAVARENSRKAGVERQVELLEGSAFDVDFGGPYDAALLTNFLHHFDRGTCVRLLRKVHASLREGGCAATLEFVPNEDRVSPPTAAGFSMVMLTSTVAGDAYTFSELASTYREAGFREVTAEPVPAGAHTIVSGIR
jgi:ubiquinone/menaquinone biosynthesis C-methylase UbiE